MRLLRACLFALVIVCVWGGALSAAGLLNSPWPAFRHDSSHSGASPLFGPPDGALVWEYTLDGPSSSSPTVGNGVIYAIGGGQLRAVSTGGGLLWSFPLGGTGKSSPAIAQDGTVYVASTDSWLYAIYPDGSLRWKKSLPGPSETSPTVAADGTVYVGCSTGAFQAYRTTGMSKFSYTAGGGVSSSAAVAADGTIYFGCDDGKLYALKADGTLKWKYSTSPASAIRSSPAVGSDGIVYFGTTGGHLYAITATGALRWRFTAGNSIQSSPALAPDGTICFGCRDHYLYAVTKATGALKWKYRTDGYVESSPCVDGAGTVYVGSNDGSIHAIRPDGSAAWSVPMGSAIVSSPAIGDAGTVYVTTQAGALCCFGSVLPPPAPVVFDDGFYSSFPDSLHAEWTCSDPHGSISAYEYAIGTAEGAEDLVAYTRIAATNEITCTGLPLVNGGRYYFAVRAVNRANQVGEAGFSDGITVDFTPPATPVVIDDGPFTASANALHVAYSSGDIESGIQSYDYSVGTTPGAADVLGWTIAGLVKDVTIDGLSLSAGSIYYVSVRATNRAGLASVGHSDGIRVDLTPPEIASVMVQGALTELRVTIEALDAESGIAGRQYFVMGDPVVPENAIWVDGSPSGVLVIPGEYDPAKTYYVAVRVVNGAGTSSAPKVSDIVRFDSTPPTQAVVIDDGDFQADQTSLHAQWSAQDPETGIARYSYCIGTSAGASDILDWRDTPDSGATVPGLSLANGATYFFTVRAVNKAGLAGPAGSSNGITIDITPPSAPGVSDDGDYTGASDCLHAAFAASDAQSGIVACQYCVGTSPGAADVLPWTMGSGSGIVTAVGLTLIPEVSYFVSVKVKNGAGLWSLPGTSNGIEYRPGVSVWPKFRCDLANDGRCGVRGPSTNRLHWRLQTLGYVESSAAIAGDGTAYIGSADGKLYAISPSGTIRWAYQTGGCLDSSPAIGPGGLIYAGSYDGGLYCVNPNGTLQWKYTAGGMIWSSPAVSAGGVVYFGSQDGYLYALNPDGTRKWRYYAGASIWSSPAVGPNGTVYFSAGNGRLHALSSTGVLLWKYQSGSAADSSPAVGQGVIYFGSGDGNFYAINADGTLKWKVALGLPVDSSAAIGNDGTIYVGSGGAGSQGALHAFSPAGVELWRLNVSGGVRSSPAVAGDGVIYVGSANGKMYAIRPDGSVLWDYATGHSILGSPAFAPDGSLVVGCDDGGVYCFRDRPATDLTPPTVPEVRVARSFISPSQPLSAWWSSTDPESGIESYSYAIGTGPGADDLVPWTNIGLATNVTRGDCQFVQGGTYYVSVRATNNALLTSGVGVSSGMVYLPGESSTTIGVAKKQLPGTEVTLPGKIVTAAFADGFAIEEPDRSAGIRCLSSTPVVARAGVNVTGKISTLNGEVVLTDVSVSQIASAVSVGAVMVTTRAIAATGADLKGMLVKIAGRVTGKAKGCFGLFDGARMYTSFGWQGMEVKTLTDSTPAIGTFVSVIGIPCRETRDGIPVTVLRATEEPSVLQAQ